MDFLGWLLRAFLIVALGAVGLGAGLCSMIFLPQTLKGHIDLALIGLVALGFAIAAGCVWAIVGLTKSGRRPDPIPRNASETAQSRDSDSDAPPPPEAR